MPVVDHYEGKVVRLQCDKAPEKIFEDVKATLKASYFFCFAVSNVVGFNSSFGPWYHECR